MIRPAIKAQNGAPMLNIEILDAVIAKVIIAAMRWRSITSAWVNAPLKAPKRARPDIRTIRVAGRDAKTETSDALKMAKIK